MTDDEERRLLTIFKNEAQDHLEEIQRKLQDIAAANSSEERKKLVEEIYREAHSLKGAAQTVKWPSMESISRALSSLFYAVFRRSIVPSQELMDAVRHGLSIASALLASGRESSGDPSTVQQCVSELQSISAKIMGPS